MARTISVKSRARSSKQGRRRDGAAVAPRLVEQVPVANSRRRSRSPLPRPRGRRRRSDPRSRAILVGEQGSSPPARASRGDRGWRAAARAARRAGTSGEWVTEGRWGRCPRPRRSRAGPRGPPRAAPDLGGASLGVETVGEVELVRVRASVGADGETSPRPSLRRCARSVASSADRLAGSASSCRPPSIRVPAKRLAQTRPRPRWAGRAGLGAHSSSSSGMSSILRRERASPRRFDGIGELELRRGDLGRVGGGEEVRPSRGDRVSPARARASMRSCASEVKRSGWRRASCDRSSAERCPAPGSSGGVALDVREAGADHGEVWSRARAGGS